VGATTAPFLWRGASSERPNAPNIPKPDFPDGVASGVKLAFFGTTYRLATVWMGVLVLHLQGEATASFASLRRCARLIRDEPGMSVASST